VCEIEHHDVVISGRFADEFPEQNPHKWKKHALITAEQAIEPYMVEVIAESHC
jgi:hypothetical protein